MTTTASSSSRCARTCGCWPGCRDDAGAAVMAAAPDRMGRPHLDRTACLRAATAQKRAGSRALAHSFWWVSSRFSPRERAAEAVLDGVGFARFCLDGVSFGTKDFDYDYRTELLHGAHNDSADASTGAGLQSPAKQRACGPTAHPTAGLAARPAAPSPCRRGLRRRRRRGRARGNERNPRPERDVLQRGQRGMQPGHLLGRRCPDAARIELPVLPQSGQRRR